MAIYKSTKLINLGSCAFRQWKAAHSHCRYIHGYNLTTKIVFACTDLDNKNWCVDFGGLKELRKELEYMFDHTLCVSSDDPALSTFKSLHEQGIIQLRILSDGVGCERFSEYVFNGTMKYLETKGLNDRCWVESVEVFEHANNSAIYVNPSPGPTELNLANTLSKAVSRATCKDLDTINKDGVQCIVSDIQKRNDEPETLTTNTSQPLNNPVTPGLGDMFAGTFLG